MYEFKIYRGILCHAIKNDGKLEEELICQFIIDMTNFKNFDPSTRKSQKFALLDCFWRKYIMFELKSTEELCLMTMNIDAKCEGKLTCAFENDIKNLASFHSQAQK